jgi:hypothetical protein
MRRMDTTPSDSNAIDLFIKYGAAIGAVAYGLGLLEQYDFFERVGIRGDFSFTDPRYFALGTYLLGQAMFPLAAVSFEPWLSALLYPERGAKKPDLLARLEVKLNRYAAVLYVLITFGMIFTLALTVDHAWVRDALWVSTAGAAAGGIAIFEIRRMRKRGRLDLWEPVYPLFVITFCLVFFALGAAKVRWRRVLAEQGQEQVRLLVEGDAVRGVQEMGLTFPELRSGDKSAGLSGPVEVVFESERTYVLRVNGQVVRLGKGKVLGSVP